MNFVAFPVGTTNIFPLANSSAGGQLMSEWNLRSRESVDTDSTVKYFIGKSFTHSMEDFAVYGQRDGYDNTISNTTIQITPGRAIINGHYVESLVPINIDLNDANYLASKEGITTLRGDLAVGLRMAYSTYQTLAASALIENEDDYYDGVQIVIVPKDSVKLPKDVPGENQFSQINMHLLLATFSFRNGSVSRINQNSDKMRSVDAERIANIDDIISNTYVSKANLDPNKLYIFAGKSADGEHIDGRDTWCEAEDSLAIWDKVPSISTVKASAESHFEFDETSGNTYLVVAHKQVDGMVNTGGQSVYYQDHNIPLPSASFDNSTGGVVTPSYTQRIKDIRDKVDKFYRLPNGTMRAYVSILSNREDLPLILDGSVGSGDDVPTWEIGDFVLVDQDNTTDWYVDGRAPSTMYVVGPGYINSISSEKLEDGGIHTSAKLYINSPSYIEELTLFKQDRPKLARTHQVLSGLMLATATISDPSEAAEPNKLWNYSTYRGVSETDYFVAYYKEAGQDEDGKYEIWTAYYWTVITGEPRMLYYDDPIMLTGGVPFATEEAVGGFLNVPSNAYGGGYVRIDDTGHLKLVDYDLLLTGILAFQLGENHTEGSGLSLSDLQTILDEDINNRWCFPSDAHIAEATAAGEDPSVLHLYLTLPEESGTLTINNVGTRYGASLYVHISGKATSATTLNFVNCDKLRIDSNIEGAPIIHLSKCNLYYDAEVIDYVTGVENLSLWYQQYSNTDPNIQVDGMTVTLLGSIESTESIDPWDSEYANDNHYAYALRSLTFGTDGSIINIGMLVGDSTTANIDEGKSVFATEFILPQSVGLGYPATKMTNRIKVSGSFVSHYYITGEDAYMMKHTDFSAITQKYNTVTGMNSVGGTISFYTDAEIVSHINGVPEGTTIDGWDLNTPHFFTGGVVD